MTAGGQPGEMPGANAQPFSSGIPKPLIYLTEKVNTFLIQLQMHGYKKKVLDALI